MALIIPSILEENLNGFQRKLTEVLKIPNLKRAQIDFSDGKFTPHKTVEISDIEMLNPAFFWEAHLMVENPSDYFLDAKIAGFNHITFHYEAMKDDNEISKIASSLKELKVQFGLGINPDTDIEKIFPLVGSFSQVLIMSVQPGYQGGSFIEATYDKVKKLRNYDKNVKIEVDGGVKFSNAKRLVEAGVDMLVVGSALYEAPPTETLGHLPIPAQNFEKFEIETKNP